MKSVKMGILATAALAAFVSVSSFADEAAKAPEAAATTATKEVKTTETKVANKGKLSIKKAKEACLAGKPELKDAELRKCVKEKRAQ